MVKQKNHTARNNTVKAHRNGIKKPKIHRFTSTRGLDPKFLRNQHWAKKFDKKHRNRKLKNKVCGNATTVCIIDAPLRTREEVHVHLRLGI
ncbi:unnamed protein product [Hyaloperonospora brassicae]|uniref:60S ribosomal protein L29 n=1 Tax=Hyaloperonospora brassicae TaxID=162125 RepID=A0AAV0UVL3_HYABA|nr:unnamed protein product [Hyaloperonospora brassicae]